MYDEAAGTKAERAAAEAARVAYTERRTETHHSADLLLRQQSAASLAQRGLPKPPGAPSLAGVKDDAPPPADVVSEVMRSGLAFYQTLQAEDGHFPGDYGGPMFLMPGLVIVCHVTGGMDTVLPPPHRTEIIRYLCNHANEDGGCASQPASEPRRKF